jgi:hypothetical protein
MGALWALELYTHYWGLFIAASQLAYGLLSAPNRQRRVRLSMAFAGALLVFAAWWPVLKFHLTETGAHSSEWLPLQAADLAKTFAAYSGSFFLFGNQVFVHPWPLWAITAGVVAASVLALAGLFKGPRLAQVWLVVGIIVPFAISFRLPMYLWYRYPFLSFGAFVLLLVSGLGRVPWRWLRVGLVGFILCAEAAACFHYFHGWQKGNALQAIEYVHDLENNDSILIRPRYFSDVLSYYDRTPVSRVIDQDSLDSTEKRRALRDKRVILLSFDVAQDPVGNALRTELRVRSRRDFPAIPLHGITVYELGEQRQRP